MSKRKVAVPAEIAAPCPRCGAAAGNHCRDYRGKRKARCAERDQAAPPKPEPPAKPRPKPKPKPPPEPSPHPVPPPGTEAPAVAYHVDKHGQVYFG